MATTLTSSTLKVWIKESIKLNGEQHGGETILSVPDINEISKRIVTVTTTEAEILAFNTTAIGAGTFLAGDVRYIRITNLDDAYHVSLTFKNENNSEFGVKLDKGQSFIYNADLGDGVIDTMDASAAAIEPGAFADLANITALADTASVDLEVFVASA